MIPKFDIYGDSYYESLNGTFKETPKHSDSYGSLSTFIRGSLVLLLRAGFILVQLGSVPIENVYIILLQNIVDIAISIACFGLVGYILAFGDHSVDGTVGYGKWIASTDADLDNAILGFSACIIATAIITTLLSGRLHFVGYLLTSLLFSTFFQPIIMHWVWHDSGWLHKKQFMGHLVAFKDHSGGLVVHFSAGVVGLVGALILGRRIIRLSDIDESSIGAESTGSTITGYIFIALGLIAFSLPDPSYEANHTPENYIGIILVNNIMAMAGGIIVVVILQFLLYREPFNYWIILRCIQGAIAGLVTISCGVDVYTPIVAFAIACGAAVLFYFVVICVHNSSVEDYCNIVSIHLVCGSLGIILPTLLGSNENLGTSTSYHVRLIHLGWQIIGASVVGITLTIVFVLLFGILRVTGFLRNKTEEINHRRGSTAAVRGPDRCCLQRLFTLYPNTPYIEPGSFGKSPEQFHSYRRDPDFSPSTIPELETKLGKKATGFREPLQVATVMTDYDSPLVQMKKAKSIYTVMNDNNNKIKEDIKTCIGSIDGGGGDNKINFEEEKHILVQKLNDVAISIGKQCSYYELHRTKKHTNLLRNRHAVRKRILKTAREIHLSQNSECVSYDNKYNDGFITIKMPPKNDYIDLSDYSE